MTKPERRKYVLGSAVLLHLGAIWEYIATDSIEAADRWIAKLFDAFEAIAPHESIARRRADLTDHPGCLGWLAHTLSFTAPEQANPVRSSP
jgi:plasmid stabilization system protein ParE